MNTKHLQGIFPVFKPAGVTSAQLLEIIKTNLKTGRVVINRKTTVK